MNSLILLPGFHFGEEYVASISASEELAVLVVFFKLVDTFFLQPKRQSKSVKDRNASSFQEPRSSTKSSFKFMRVIFYMNYLIKEALYSSFDLT